jgi:hypothetical protein
MVFVHDAKSCETPVNIGVGAIFASLRASRAQGSLETAVKGDLAEDYGFAEDRWLERIPHALYAQLLIERLLRDR